MRAERLGWTGVGLAALALAVAIGAHAGRPAPAGAGDDFERRALEEEIAGLRQELAAARGEWERSEPAAVETEPEAGLDRSDELERVLARLSALEVRAAAAGDRPPADPDRPPVGEGSVEEPPAALEEKWRAARSEGPAIVGEALIAAGLSPEGASALAPEIVRWEAALAEIKVRQDLGEEVSDELREFHDSVRNACRTSLPAGEVDAFAASFPHLAGRGEERADSNPAPPAQAATASPEAATRPAGQGER